MRTALVVVATCTILTGPLNGQAKSASTWCSESSPSIDSLRALVVQYHAPALRKEFSDDSLLVGFILDPTCHVVQHAAGHYHASHLGVDSLLTSLFPNAQLKPFLAAGIAEASEPKGSGSPWIVWVMKKA